MKRLRGEAPLTRKGNMERERERTGLIKVCGKLSIANKNKHPNSSPNLLEFSTHSHIFGVFEF